MLRRGLNSTPERRMCHSMWRMGDLGSNVRLSYRCACKHLPGSVGTLQCRSWVARPSLKKRQHPEYRQLEVLPRMGNLHCEASHFRPV